MKTEEIVELTREGICKLLEKRRKETDDKHAGRERRTAPRWPFAGTVEIWSDDRQAMIPCLGSLRDLSQSGLGMKCDGFFEPGTEIEIAVHVPEASFCGRGIVRYCKQVRREFMTGVEFCFGE
jgi:hypothetical protein